MEILEERSLYFDLGVNHLQPLGQSFLVICSRTIDSLFSIILEIDVWNCLSSPITFKTYIL